MELAKAAYQHLLKDEKELNDDCMDFFAHSILEEKEVVNKVKWISSVNITNVINSYRNGLKYKSDFSRLYKDLGLSPKNIRDYQVILFSIYDPLLKHWSLVSYYTLFKHGYYYDSLRSKTNDTVSYIFNIMIDTGIIEKEDAEILSVDDVAIQQSLWECGYHVLKQVSLIVKHVNNDGELTPIRRKFLLNKVKSDYYSEKSCLIYREKLTYFAKKKSIQMKRRRYE